ncbi:hypothetical protein [endosymbiont GvMRE of Glomus versiforme]|uniref:hypothetical protein n=1 Tax=endosymbiont GvMRE of Glomus versiforme TaxID=2039283 RepID=UPI000EDC5005|nr:hypothetical protein [endosymbiont GvMRE of Glomus versiforme]RHZ36508.1 hypothetical protein GvMRE_I2g219 [endosymbiont GvMRE of Glomus versiforme]
MPRQLFKLISKEYSEKFQEWWWTYEVLFEFIFNKRTITYITITSYYQTKLGRKMITNELILELLVKLNGKILEAMEYDGNREPYEWEVFRQGKPYVLFFWFKDDTINHLWIRNCHWID